MNSPTTETEYPVRNAVTCRICRSPADRHHTFYQCQANPAHLGDLYVGIFSDLTYPEQSTGDKP
jgi:hypothetical protein